VDVPQTCVPADCQSIRSWHYRLSTLTFIRVHNRRDSNAVALLKPNAKRGISIKIRNQHPGYTTVGRKPIFQSHRTVEGVSYNSRSPDFVCLIVVSSGNKRGSPRRGSAYIW